MSESTCDAKDDMPTSLDPLRKVAIIVLNNRVVEAAVIAAISVGFIAITIIDSVLGIRAERMLIDSIRDVSKGKLSSLRKAQIRHVFRCQFGLSRIKIRLAGGSYWLSIPCIVEGRKDGKTVRYMAKIINGMSATKHRYMTQLRNMGVQACAGDLMFEEYADAKDMIDFERHCLAVMRDQSIAVPAVIGMYRLNEDDYMMVIEYIDGKPLSKVDIGEEQVDQVFRDIRIMHEHGFVHGDIKLDNFLVSNGKIFVLDCLKVGHTGLESAACFDTICAICSMCQKMPVETVMKIARRHFSAEELQKAAGMLDIALKKVDIILPEERVEELRDALGIVPDRMTLENIL